MRCSRRLLALLLGQQLLVLVCGRRDGHTAINLASDACTEAFDAQKFDLLSGAPLNPANDGLQSFVQFGRECLQRDGVYLLFAPTTFLTFMDEDDGYLNARPHLQWIRERLQKFTNADWQEHEQIGVCSPPPPTCIARDAARVAWHFVKSRVIGRIWQLFKVPKDFIDFDVPFGAAVLANMTQVADVQAVAEGDQAYMESARNYWVHGMEPWVDSPMFAQLPWLHPSIQAHARSQAQAGWLKAQGITPHFVLDDVLPPALLRDVAKENPERPVDRSGCLGKNWVCWPRKGSQWVAAKNVKEEQSSMGPATKALYRMLFSRTWISFLQDALDIRDELHPRVVGAGIQSTLNGGHLMLHADYNEAGWFARYRRVNVFVYLNPDWKDQFGGHLEFWNPEVTECGARILPVFGRVVAFRTTAYSVHGNPTPVSAPNRSRVSLALYYYSKTVPPPAECDDGICGNRRGPRVALTVNCDECRGLCCASSCPGKRSLE